MELFISSETYAPIGSEMHETGQTQIFKTINPVLAKFKEREYGQEFTSIAIIPIIMPEDMHDAYKERILLKRKAQDADIRLYIDYEKFKNADIEKRILLFWQNIIKSIKAINDRKKNDFKGECLINDLLFEINMSFEEINDL